MWQRFTESARRVVFYAQEDAQRYGEGYVSTEHLLLGLVREDENTAISTLRALGIEPQQIRDELEKHLPRGRPKPSSDTTLTPRAKRVIDLAYHEAKEHLNNNFIGTEHLLLGLIREGDGMAGRVLSSLGLEIERARQAVRGVQEEKGVNPPPRRVPPPADPWAPYGPTVRRAMDVAEDEAQARGQTFLTSEHLLLGILGDRESPACRALASLNVDLDSLWNETAAGCRTMGSPRQEDTLLSAAATKAFAIAFEEQRELDDEKVETEHLMLGLLREHDNVAGRLLDRFGVEREALRRAIRIARTNA